MARKYAIKQFVIADDTFYAITCPIDCVNWSLKGPNDILVRSNASDSTTEATLSAGDQERMLTPPTFPYITYRQGDTVIYAKNAASGSVTIIGRFAL